MAKANLACLKAHGRSHLVRFQHYQGSSRTEDAAMSFKRFIPASFALGLGLICGCSSTDRPLLGRLTGHFRNDPKDNPTVMEGPMLDDCGPVTKAPPIDSSVISESGLPLSPPPRLVPRPRNPNYFYQQ
jgi:hypothetical protein